MRTFDPQPSSGWPGRRATQAWRRNAHARFRGAGVRISSGVPLPNKSENRGRGTKLLLRRAPGQDGFRAADADFVVRDGDFTHNQPGA